MPVKQYVIGVDGGGSKTAVALLDQDGRVLGRGLSGSTNHHNVGLAQTKRNLWAGMSAAAQEAGVTMQDVSAATWALAGVDRLQERRLFGELAAEMLPAIPVQVKNDAVAALVGGLGHHYGVALIAGTGMIAYGENEAGKVARAGGWGSFFDRGSAYDLVQNVLRSFAVVHDSQQARSTELADNLLAAAGLSKITDFLVWVYESERQVSDIANLAPIIVAAAEQGDLVAVAAVNQGVSGLAAAVASVARQLDYQAAFPLVLCGGLLAKSDFYRGLVVQAARNSLPEVQPHLPRADAAVGAGLMALEWVRQQDSQADGVSPTFQTGESALAADGQGDARLWTSERPHLLSRNLDMMSMERLVGLMHLEDQEAVASMAAALPALAQAIEEISARMARGGRLIYIGAGTSGRLGVLDASECPPTFNSAPDRVVGIIAGGDGALRHSIEGAEDDEAAGMAALRGIEIEADDSVVGIAASGRTPYVLGALREAKRVGALAVALVCNLPAPLAEAAEITIAPLVGPELLTGSTRLKAGTAQKLALNMISTGVMVRLGKTYGNLMVDLQASNSKLQARARRIVALACGLDEETAGAALQACDGEVKTAIVSTLTGLNPAEARARLAAVGGVVREAVKREMASV